LKFEGWWHPQIRPPLLLSFAPSFFYCSTASSQQVFPLCRSPVVSWFLIGASPEFATSIRPPRSFRYELVDSEDTYVTTARSWRSSTTAPPRENAVTRTTINELQFIFWPVGDRHEPTARHAVLVYS
jgi:hypothetical protein